MWRLVLSFLIIFFGGINQVNANTWAVIVEDDLFSSSGKKAVLGSPGRGHVLIFECENDLLGLALLLRERVTFDEPLGFSVPVSLIIKVDEAEPVHFDAEMYRRNENYVQAVYSSDYEDEKLLSLLGQVEGAQSKILAGIDVMGEKKSSYTVSVTGSTRSAKEFKKACGISSD